MNESTDQRVARLVGRELEPSELDKYPHLDAIPASVAEIVAVVTMKDNAILAGRYLLERVRASNMDIKASVERFTEQWMSRWTSSDEVATRDILGRGLESGMPATFDDMMDPSSAVTADATTLAHRDYTLACKYILHRVPGLHLSGAMSWVEGLPDTNDQL